MKKSFQVFIFVINITITAPIIPSIKQLSTYEQRKATSLKLRKELAEKNNLDMRKQPQKQSSAEIRRKKVTREEQARLEKIDREMQPVIASVLTLLPEYRDFILPHYSKREPTQIIRKYQTNEQKHATEMQIHRLNNPKKVIPVKQSCSVKPIQLKTSETEPQASPSFKQKQNSAKKPTDDGLSLSSFVEALYTKKRINTDDNEALPIKMLASPTSITHNHSPYKLKSKK